MDRPDAARIRAAATPPMKTKTSMGRELAKLAAVSEERKQAPDRLADAATILEHSPIVLARVRFPELPKASPVTEYMSANFTRFGYPADDLMSGQVDFFRDVIHKDDRARAIAGLEDAIRAGRAGAEADFRLVGRDGGVRWAEGRMTFERDAAGRVCTGFGVLWDITERREAEQKLRFANTILVTAMETSLDAILVVDRTS